MAQPATRLRSGSFITPATTSPRASLQDEEVAGKSPQGPLGDLFRRLSLAGTSPRSVTPTRSQSSTALPRSARSLNIEAKTPTEQSVEYFAQYLCTLFTHATVKLRNDRLTISFDYGSQNSAKSSNHCLPTRISTLLSESTPKIEVAVEISTDALAASSDSRYHQFLEEIAPYLVSLKCFASQPSQKLTFNTKWNFPLLTHLDLSGCSDSAEIISQIESPLNSISVRKAKGFSAANLFALFKRWPSIREIEFKKCPDITIDDLKKAYAADSSHLLFFLKMAKKFNHKLLEEVSIARLKELIGNTFRLDFANGDLLLVLTYSKSTLDNVQGLIQSPIPLQIVLEVAYEQREDPEVAKFLEKFRCKFSIQISRMEVVTAVNLSKLTACSELKFSPGSVVRTAELAEVQNALPDLQSLDLSGCLVDVPESGFSAINEFKNLRRVSFNGSGWVSEEFVLSLFDNCSALTSIDVRGCPKINPVLQAAFFRENPYRPETRVDWNQPQSDQAVKTVARLATASTKLFLDLAGMRAVEPVLPFFSRAHPIKQLSIHQFAMPDTQMIEPLLIFSGLQKLTLEGPIGASAMKQLKEFRELTSLSLTTDEKKLEFVLKDAVAGDESLQEFGLPRLEKLTLRGFSELTVAGIQGHVKQSRRLSQLRIHNCHKVAEAALKKFCQECGIVLSYSSSPLQIVLRKAVESDRIKVKTSLEAEIANYRTIIEDAPLTRPENMQEFHAGIAEAQRVIRELTSLELDVQAATEKLSTIYRGVQQAYPENPEVSQMDLKALEAYHAKLVAVQAAAETSSNIVWELINFRRGMKKDRSQLAAELQDVGTQYEQSLQVSQDTQAELANCQREIADLANKTVTLTIIADGYKELIPMEEKIKSSTLAKNSGAAKLMKKIGHNSSQRGKIEFTLLFTREELGSLVQLELLPNWILA